MKKIKIGFDAKRLFLNKSGLGVYARALVKALSVNLPEADFHLYTTDDLRWDETEWFFKAQNITIHKGPNRFKSIWRSFGIKKDLIQDGIDIYHGLAGELPWGLGQSTIRTVVTVHDMIFKFFPEHYTFADRFIYAQKMKFAVADADRLVSVSESTMEDLRRFFPDVHDLENKSQVIHELTHEKYYHQPSLNVSKSLPYFLFVGDTNPRKNLAITLRVFESLAAKHDDLVLKITAPYEHYVNNLIRLNIRKYKDRIQIIEQVSTDQMISLYSGAVALIYPSIYEGFGLPLLESRLMGKFAITTNRKPFTEVADPQSTIFLDPPIHESELLLAMSKALQIRGQEWSSKLSRVLTPSHIVAQYIKLYQELA